MKFNAAIPILRIFDEEKARQFYLDFLEFTIDFEHRFHEGAPLFMGVSRDGLELYLSEHHGDGTPGTYVLVDMDGVEELCAQLQAKKYKYFNPSLQQQEWGRLDCVVYDPFGNRIIFSQDNERS